jgi:(5-formylfuran-3-yl)methyl phosphate synthase
MRLLVSVRNVDEALIAAREGADLIDLKEPGEGALGGLPPAAIREIVAALRSRGFGQPLSATIGDLPMHDLARILARVQVVGACGVDYVKVGIEPSLQGDWVLEALAVCGQPVVPVLLADCGVDLDRVAHAASLGFAGLMLDTADKQAGSLLARTPEQALRGFLAAAREAGAIAGVAGALAGADMPALLRLGPDFAGFRSALCSGERSGEMDALRLRALVAMRDRPPHGWTI